MDKKGAAAREAPPERQGSAVHDSIVRAPSQQQLLRAADSVLKQPILLLARA